jgi:hypothetical protein
MPCTYLQTGAFPTSYCRKSSPMGYSLKIWDSYVFVLFDNCRFLFIYFGQYTIVSSPLPPQRAHLPQDFPHIPMFFLVFLIVSPILLFVFSIPAEGGEWDLLPCFDREEYLSLFFRFYLAVQRGLAVGPDKVQYLQTLDRSGLFTTVFSVS